MAHFRVIPGDTPTLGGHLPMTEIQLIRCPDDGCDHLTTLHDAEGCQVRECECTLTGFQKDHSDVDHPDHYTWLPGVECIDITEHFGFNLGNAIKYLYRCDKKGDAIKDLRKAAWYIQRELDRRSRMK